jgi:hypothetical protein
MSAGGIKKKDTDIDGDFFAILCTATKLILIHSTISCFFCDFVEFKKCTGPHLTLL